jgi:hypothetical protein
VRSLITELAALVPVEPPDRALREMRLEALMRGLPFATDDGVGMAAPRPVADNCATRTLACLDWFARRATTVLVERTSKVAVGAALEERDWYNSAPSWGESGLPWPS